MVGTSANVESQLEWHTLQILERGKHTMMDAEAEATAVASAATAVPTTLVTESPWPQQHQQKLHQSPWPQQRQRQRRWRQQKW